MTAGETIWGIIFLKNETTVFNELLQHKSVKCSVNSQLYLKKSQIPAWYNSSSRVGFDMYWLLNRKLGVLLIVAAMKSFTTHTGLAMWTSSRLPYLTFHLHPKSCCYKHTVIVCVYVCVCFCHGLSVASVNRAHIHTSDAMKGLFPQLSWKKHQQ